MFQLFPNTLKSVSKPPTLLVLISHEQYGWCQQVIPHLDPCFPMFRPTNIVLRGRVQCNTIDLPSQFRPGIERCNYTSDFEYVSARKQGLGTCHLRSRIQSYKAFIRADSRAGFESLYPILPSSVRQCQGLPPSIRR